MDEIRPVLAVNVAEVAPAATVTEEGRLRVFAIAPPMLTAAPPVGAAVVRVTVQVVLELEVRAHAAHCRDETSTEPESVRGNDLDEPFSAAVRVALRSDVRVAVVAVNVAVAAPAATVTDDGTVRMPAIPPPSVTTEPPAGAAPDMVTVQVVLAFDPRAPVPHCSEDSTVETFRERVALPEEPLSEAVTVAL